MALLSVIEYNGVHVLTSAQLAESYDTNSKVILKNLQRHKNDFEERVHFFLLKGEDLKAFKASRQNDVNLKNAPLLYLWTEKGAWLHANFLSGERAREGFKLLIDSYYRNLEQQQQEQTLAISHEQLLQLEGRVEVLEQQLQEALNRPTLNAKQQVFLQKAIKRRVYQLTNEKGAQSALFRAVHLALRERYQVGSYKDIRQCDQQDAVQFVMQWGGGQS